MPVAIGGSNSDNCHTPLTVTRCPCLEKDLSAWLGGQRVRWEKPLSVGTRWLSLWDSPWNWSWDRRAEGERGVPGYSQDCVVALGNYDYSPGVCESHGELRPRSKLSFSKNDPSCTNSSVDTWGQLVLIMPDDRLVLEVLGYLDFNCATCWIMDSSICDMAGWQGNKCFVLFCFSGVFFLFFFFFPLRFLMRE